MIDSKMIGQLPDSSGVYMMKDKSGKIIYVGKAKSLRKRVASYLRPGGDGRSLMPYLQHDTEQVDIVLVTSEVEALLLENNLIKHHQPKYNILLKDDKSYIALKLSLTKEWPRLELVRYRRSTQESKRELFGPYTAFMAKQMEQIIQESFPLRRCSDHELKNRSRPCLLHGMKRCLAPCVNLCTKEDYRLIVEEVREFLSGRNQEALARLEAKIQQASSRLDFEQAALLHETREKWMRATAPQSVEVTGEVNAELLYLEREANRIAFTILSIREGKLIEIATHLYDSHFEPCSDPLPDLLPDLQRLDAVAKSPMPNQSLTVEDPLSVLSLEDAPSDLPIGESLSDLQLHDSQLLESLTLQHLSQMAVPLPKKCDLWISLAPPALKVMNQTLRLLDLDLKCRSPKTGSALQWLELAKLNAGHALATTGQEKSKRYEQLGQLKKALHLDQLPLWIECIDTSHHSGHDHVASIVAFVDGQPQKTAYRHYRVLEAKGDDYSAMRQALIRRFDRAKKEGQWPQLLIVDGGVAHLHLAQELSLDYDFVGLELLAISKEKSKHSKGLNAEWLHRPVFTDLAPSDFASKSLGSDDPARSDFASKQLDSHDPALHLVQRIRDEAHRFAIEYQRKRHSKKLTHSALDDIPGIGPKKKALLMRHFGSLAALRRSHLKELQSLPLLNERDCERLIEFLQIPHS